MSAKAILNLIPLMRSTALLKENIPKLDSSGKGIRANKGRAGCKKTKLVGQGVRNIVGINLIKLEADIIGGF